MYCTNCGAEISEGAVICVKCGSKPTSHKNYCGNCGTETSKEAVVCVKCGHSLTASDQTGAPTAKSNRWTIALILAIFLGTVGGHSFYTGQTKRGIMQLALCLVLMCIASGCAIFWTFIFPILLITVPMVYLPSYIWAIMDIVKICKGQFPDKDGSLLKKN